MLRTDTIKHLPQGGWAVRKEGWEYTKKTAPLARDHNKMCKHTTCGSSPRELGIHCLGERASVEQPATSQSCPLWSMA